ncbi:MAG: hypothetical protein QW424_01450 [Candidatus Bathyarchaeia archaeon]
MNSWLTFNGINVKLKVNVRGESDAPTIANECVPNGTRELSGEVIYNKYIYINSGYYCIKVRRGNGF